ncbi:MAG: protein kinase [Myxococcales bacterium]|nr:protein kinase [Myxococcales bacterium]
MTRAIDPTLATQAATSGERSTTGVLESEILQSGAVVANRYRIDALLGEGGMGAVYRAHDLELDEEIALKTLRRDISNDLGAIERFRREVKLARKVTHPNVARTFDLCACEEFKFITMELIEGTSLSDRIGAGAMALSEALRVCADIARGLVAAHSAGVVHRDLKPDNVMLAGAKHGAPLSGHERVVITDFGIARAADSNEREGADERSESQRGKALTVGGIVGTPAYMAPEQIVGETPDGRSDVYALGALLFELLAARLPFVGDSAVAIAMARLSQPPPDVRQHNADIPEAVAELLLSMLARDRKERPDAVHVLDEIEKLRGVSHGSTGNPVAGLAKVPGTTTMMLDASSAPKYRSVAVMPLTSAEPALAPFARELGATLADALSRVRTLKVLPPSIVAGSGAADDLAALAKGARADVALSGSVRAEGERLRVNLRYIELSQGTQRWAERFEGTLAAPFAMEDTLARAAEAALRALSGGNEAATAGPSDPAARALYDRAVECSHKAMDPAALAQGLDLARRAHELAPSDASVMSLLGFLLVRVALSRRSEDNQHMIAEAEDWALRALNADAGSASTFVTLGLVRLHQGDVRSSVRAFREALARDARNAEASAYLGRFLIESGYVDEGIKRLEFALKLEPNIQHAWWNLARSYALLSNWQKSDEVMQQALAATGSEVTLNLVRGRVAFWRGDHEFATFTADRIDAVAPEGHFSRGLVEPLRAFARGEKPAYSLDEFRRGAGGTSPALAAFWYQVGAEVFAVTGRFDAALDAIEGAVSLPFIDVGWMDHCPALASIRGAGRFGQARAIVAARAANLWK